MSRRLISGFSWGSKLISIGVLVYLQSVIVGTNAIDRYYSVGYQVVLPVILLTLTGGHLYLGIKKQSSSLLWSAAFPVVVLLLYLASLA